MPISPTPPSTPAATTLPAPQTVSLGVVADRAAHTATTLRDGSLLVAGGCIVDGCGTATADTFLVKADATGAVTGPQMSTPRDGHTATTAVSGDVLLVGGFSGEGQGALATIDVYRAQTGQIEAFAPLSLARGGQAAAALGDGTILVVGGWIRSRTYTATAEIVDPAGGTVRAAPDLPWSADALDAVTLADGRVLVTGGQAQSAIATDAAAVYDPSIAAWTSVGPMLTPRLKHLTVLLGDGRVLIMGGTPDDEHWLATTEIFDPTTMLFSAGPDMFEPRYKMPGGALVVDATRVLIAGGGRMVELLDVPSGESRVIETLGARGSFATLNALGGQAWLVLGGYDDQITLRRQFLVIRPEDLEAAGG